MIKKRLIYLILSAYAVSNVLATDNRTPLEVVSSIGDKLIRTTSFENRLIVPPNSEDFTSLKFVDFKRTYGDHSAAFAYALTTLNSNEKFILKTQIEHNDHCIVWLNGEEVYNQHNPSKIRLQHEERSVELTGKLELSLKKGMNMLLVQLNTKGEHWMFYFQPEPGRGMVSTEKRQSVQLTLKGLPHVDGKVADLSSWLVCGPFENPVPDFHEILTCKWGKMYEDGKGEKVTWTLPKIDIWGDVIDPAPWGTNYNWNYHNGGVVWAMQILSEVTGNTGYADFADNFCNFHLENIPFIEYQVKTLNAFNCANHHIYETPLLDFTLAPSLPYIYRLNTNCDFYNRSEYVAFVERMLEYSKSQVRLPGSTAYTRLTPEIYTTWVDDMFMGIPFLIQAYHYTKEQSYLDDAAQQVLDFNKIVWDADNKLYMHANYSNRPDVKLPHWTRANGWGLWATTEVLQALNKKNSRYKSILIHFREHINSLIKYQNERGFWYNVLEYPESREEVSGTAIIAMAVARGVRHGWLEEKKYRPIALKAWEALKTQIAEDGTVGNICYGTMCSGDVDYYCKRPFYTDDTHGLFAVLFAGIEVYKMMEINN